MKGDWKFVLWVFLCCVPFVGISQKVKPKALLPLEIEAQFTEGMRFYLKDDFQEALLLWESLAAEKVKDAGLFYYLGKVNIQLNNEANALMYAEMAHQMMPASLDYGLFYVDLLLKKRKFQESIEVLKKVSAFDESQPEVNIRLAQAYLMLENGDEAIKALNKADHYIGDFPVIIRTKQFIYLKQKKWKEFQEASLHFLENFPEENLLEWELLEMLPIEEASVYEPLLDSILVDYPNVQQVNFIKSINRLKKNDFLNASKYIQLTYSDDRVEPDVLAAYFEDFHKTLLKNKDTFQLMPMLQKAFEIYPTSAELAYVLGDVAINQEKPDIAQKAYLNSLQLGIKRYEAYAELVQLDMYFNHLDSALVHVNKALQKFPSNGFFYFQKGFVQSYRNETNEAIATLVAGLAFADKRFDYYVRIQSMLGDLFHKVGKYVESDEAFEKALEIDPKDDHVLNNYSYFLALRKENLERALKLSAQLIELLPENETYLDTHGWVWFQMGNYEKAFLYIQKAYTNSLEPSSEITEHLGDVLFKLNRKKEGINYWKIAFKKNNQNKLLEKKIQKKDYFEN